MTDYVPHTFVTRNGKMNLGLANIKQKAKYRIKKVTLKMNNKKSKKYWLSPHHYTIIIIMDKRAEYFKQYQLKL